MTAPLQTQTINSTQLSGARTFTFANNTVAFVSAVLTIDRTVANGLNSLPTTATLDVQFDFSPDGGNSWHNIGGKTIIGGTYVTKGVTLATETLGIGQGTLFPVGTGFRIVTAASTPVRIAGTVEYFG